MENEKIIELYWARKEDAIVETDRAYGRKLHTLADRIVHSYEDAEESVSDTYMKAWETIPPQRPAYFFAYLAKICRNFALIKLNWKNAAKRKAEVIALTQEMELCIPDEIRNREVADKEIGQALNCFVKSLSPENRVLFLRRYWYAETIAEISARFHMSESSVKTRLHRLRGKLRTYLESEGIYV